MKWPQNGLVLEPGSLSLCCLWDPPLDILKFLNIFFSWGRGKNCMCFNDSWRKRVIPSLGYSVLDTAQGLMLILLRDKICSRYSSCSFWILNFDPKLCSSRSWKSCWEDLFLQSLCKLTGTSNLMRLQISILGFKRNKLITACICRACLICCV